MTTSNPITTEPTSPVALPLFYQNPEALRVAVHGRAGLAGTGGTFGFARPANAVPIVLAEFAAAARQYPIVFVGEDEPVPVIVLGKSSDTNLFVDNTGNWREACYVPAYVRRYPFIPITGSNDQMTLGIDIACERYVDNCGDEPMAMRLFDDAGEPASFVREAMQLCKEYSDFHAITAEFCKALRNAGLLVPATMQTADGHRVRGFSVVEGKALSALDDATVVAWWRNGWMDAIALHRASQRNWPVLAGMEASQTMETPLSS